MYHGTARSTPDGNESTGKSLSIDDILNAESLVDEIDSARLQEIAMECIEGYEDDLASRSSWEERMECAIKLAQQMVEKKNTPWPNAANVKFPLITISAIQFNSRVLPALIPGPKLVNMRVIGPDPQGLKKSRADRVSAHMSYQFLEEDTQWEEGHDKLLISTPILGSGFKKTYYNADKGFNVSENVLPMDLVIDYFAKSLETATRITHKIEVSRNYIVEQQRLGLFRDIELQDPKQVNETRLSDERQGLTPSNRNIPHLLLEQHYYLDLDDDGYEEPYIVTLDLESKEVLRVTPRFDEDSIIPGRKDNEIAKIIPDHYFTQYIFIPSPDGGIYGLGFGALLGPINESINTAINQLLDAGSLANLQCGFIGRGAKIKKGEQFFKPGEWKNVNATGDDLRKSIVPLPVKEPSGTLFNLLRLLIEYGERVSGVTDMMVGQTPGQNTPATTSMAALEQGQKVFTGIYKRLFRSQTKEFRKAYMLNQKYLEPEQYLAVNDVEDEKIFQQDYQGDPTDIKPAADPSVVSDMQKMQRAEALKQAAMSSPGYNMQAVEHRYLEAMGIENAEEVYPTGENAIQPPPDPKIEIEKMKTESDAQAKQMKMQIDQMKTESEAQYKFAKLESELAVMDAQVGEIETRAILNLAKAQESKDKTAIETYKAQIEKLKLDKESINESRKVRESTG